MDLRALRHAVALADELSFARAAARVHLTQSALSRSIQALEEELQARLFDRDLRHVALTAIGRQFVERARGLLFEAGTLKREVDLLRAGELGDLAFGVGPFPAATLLPPVMAELARDHPRLQVRVEINNSANLTEQLLREDIEFFVADMRSVQGNPKLTVRPMGTQGGGYFCRAGHPLAGRRLRQPREILRYPLLSARLPAALAAQVARFLGAGAKAPPVTITCDSPALLEYVAIHTDAVLMSTRAAVQNGLASGALSMLRVSGAASAPGAEIGIVALAGRSASPPAQWLVARMQAQAALLERPAARRRGAKK